jgi:hypothetical protein
MSAVTMFLVIIPALPSLAPEERALVEAGGSWPVRVYDDAPDLSLEMKAVIDFLVDSWLRRTL